jgi:hypothetical protein
MNDCFFHLIHVMVLLVLRRFTRSKSISFLFHYVRHHYNAIRSFYAHNYRERNISFVRRLREILYLNMASSNAEPHALTQAVTTSTAFIRIHCQLQLLI